MSAGEFNPEKPLREATAQEIQFELLRRARRNLLDGEKVLKSLRAHRELWRSLILAPLFVWRRDSDLPIIGLITLRDLPKNQWNADTLYVITDSMARAHDIVALAEREQWGGETQNLRRCRGDQPRRRYFRKWRRTRANLVGLVLDQMRTGGMRLSAIGGRRAKM
jgi:hypothetical protein